jgi:predicted  nucleic acid-binding Zn-ribbon protein
MPEETDSTEAASKETPAEVPATGEETNKPEADKRVQDAQRKLHEVFMEKAQLEGRLKAMEEMLASKSTPPQDDWLEKIDVETLKDDPVAIRDSLLKMRSEIAQVLKARDSFYEQRLHNLRPEIAAVKDKIAELRTDPDYATFNDDQLAVIAHKVQSTETPAPAPKGGIGGGRRAPSGGAEPNIKDSPLFKAIYGDILVDQKE